MKKNLYKKNNWLIILSLILHSSTLFSQSIVETYFKMPDILNPTLTKENRLELLEYYKVHQSDSITNRFGNQAYMVSLDTLNQRIVVKNTPTSTFEMKINFLDNQIPYIGIIRTVCAPVCQSSIEFYDTAWNVIPIQFPMPKAIEWVDLTNVPTDKIDLEWLKNSLKISFISLSFSTENNVVNAKNNTLDFLGDADRKIIKPYLSDKTLAYKLKNRKWSH